ncbi:MAG: 23S rRNA (guanosine(2251)-2'-O)-methyltransferase RlmB [Clostridiales bacterium]|nr:23S rRNA (guanosine(2251)-2'-O)-methyltransferase RlmB [Clostridiales bacterium]
MIIEGKNAVNEALKGNTTIEKVLVLKSAYTSNFSAIIKMCQEKKISVQYVEKKALDRLSEKGNHQGVIAIATEFKYSNVDDILKKKDGKDLIVILLDSIEDPHNLGAIIRVADCVGASGIIIPRRRCCGVTDTVVRVSSGASSHVKIAKVNNLNDVIRELKEMGITVFATDAKGDDIYKTNLTGDIAFVIGNEGAGVSHLTKKLSDGVISLPQLGMVNSLNASVAAGAVLYECVRQKYFQGKA